MQRDVLGFTRGAVPILAGQGIKAVTVGTNGGCAPPDVPHNTTFVWRDEASGTHILAMWHPGANFLACTNHPDAFPKAMYAAECILNSTKIPRFQHEWKGKCTS